MQSRSNLPIFITATISVALIFFSIWYVNGRDGADGSDTQTPSEEEGLKAVRGITADDHIFGSPTAPIVFYVYSDFSCSFCKEYHATMRTILTMFGEDGKVAWVFRHMPYVQLHPESPLYAHAGKCVAKERGDAGFWKFADDLFEVADPLEPLTPEELVILAEQAGATKQAFAACMSSNEFMDDIAVDFEEAIAAGAKGTPFTVVDTPSGRSVYQGAQPFKVLGGAVQSAIRSLDANGIQPTETQTTPEDYRRAFEAMEQAFTATSASTSVPTSTSTANMASSTQGATTTQTTPASAR